MPGSQLSFRLQTTIAIPAVMLMRPRITVTRPSKRRPMDFSFLAQARFWIYSIPSIVQSVSMTRAWMRLDLSNRMLIADFLNQDCLLPSSRLVAIFRNCRGTTSIRRNGGNRFDKSLCVRRIPNPRPSWRSLPGVVLYRDCNDRWNDLSVRLLGPRDKPSNALSVRNNLGPDRSQLPGQLGRFRERHASEVSRSGHDTRDFAHEPWKRSRLGFQRADISGVVVCNAVEGPRLCVRN